MLITLVVEYSYLLSKFISNMVTLSSFDLSVIRLIAIRVAGLVGRVDHEIISKIVVQREL